MAIYPTQGQVSSNPLNGGQGSSGPSVAQFLTQAQNAGLNAQDLQALNAQNTASQGNPLIAALSAEEAPALAQYGQQYATAESQLGQLPASLNLQGAQLQQSTQLQGEQLLNQLTGNTLSQQNVEQQLGIAGGQYGLQQQLAGIEQGQLAYNLPIAVSQQQSQGAATGTIGTTGYKQKLGQIGEQYQVSSAELANQLAGQGLSYKGTELSSANQLAQLQNTAQSLGISQQQLQAQLASGMTQIGISGAQQQDQLLSQAAQAQGGEAQGLGAIYSNIGALTGLGPQAFTSSYPNLYNGG